MDLIEKAYREGYKDAIEDVRNLLRRTESSMNAMLEGVVESLTPEERNELRKVENDRG